MENTYLCHYGVKGMKWGVRRYQNYDGTLTDEARKRRGAVSNFSYLALNAIAAGLSVDQIATAVSVGVTPTVIAKALATGVSTMSPKLILAGSVAAGPYLTLSVLGSGLAKSGLKTWRTNKERSESDTDPKTGLLKKSKDMTESQDVRRVNPGYGSWLANSHNNCGLCSVAYDLRRRGSEVSANKSPIGYTHKELMSFYNSPELKRISSKNNPLIDAVTMPRNAVRTMCSEPNGSRGMVLLRWTGSRSGHACNYEVKNGHLDLYDGQSGRKLISPYEYFSRADEISYFRTDNIEPNWDNIRKAVH